MKLTIPFEPHCSMMVCGASASGKTTFVVDCLKHLTGMFVTDIPSRIVYFYGIYQPLFETLENTYNVECIAGAPSAEDIDRIVENNQPNSTLIVLDDLMDIVTQSEHLCKLFTEGCHHKKICTIFLTQNLFCGGKYSRTIARNTHYFAFTKSPRNASSLRTLAAQVFSGKRRRAVVDAYEDLCDKHENDVLVIDLHPQSDRRFRIRSDIFKPDVTVYDTS